MTPSPKQIRQYISKRPETTKIAQILHHTLPSVLDSAQGIESIKREGGYTYCPQPHFVTEHPNLTSLREQNNNPILSSRQVTDFGNAWFVADPFLAITAKNDWHLFFEIGNGKHPSGAVIGHATIPDKRQSWEYDGIVLSEGYHLSFPYVFKNNDNWYMVPEGAKVDDEHAAILYTTDSLNAKWERVTPLFVPPFRINDTVVFEWENRWWALAGDVSNRNLYAFYSDSLVTDSWTAHRENPVVTDRPRAARPAGRPLISNNSIYMFYQDCVPRYGVGVREYQITALTVDEYSDEELNPSPLLEGTGGIGWNGGRIHHIDLWPTVNGWTAVTDGEINETHRRYLGCNWSIGEYGMDHNR